MRKTRQTSGERIVKDIKRKTRKRYSGWVHASKLAVGDLITEDDGGALRVSKVSFNPNAPLNVTYNLEVADFHTYFVGGDAALVHNGGPTFTPSQAAQILKKGNTNLNLRIDTARPGDPTHIHVGSTCAIRLDGTFKHGTIDILRKTLTKKQKKFLLQIKGLTLPGEY